MRVWIMACAAIGALAAPPAIAQERSLLDFTGLKGTCASLKTPEADLSKTCHWAIINLNYSDGRRNFSFFSGARDDQTVYAFSGIPDLASTDADGTIAMSVDQIFSGKGSDVRPIEVSGQCRFTWPMRATVTVTCTASGTEGDYSARFTSNGEPPVVTPLN